MKKDKAMPWDVDISDANFPVAIMHESLAMKLLELLEMARNMAWTESSLTKDTQAFAEKLHQDIFRK